VILFSAESGLGVANWLAWLATRRAAQVGTRHHGDHGHGNEHHDHEHHHV